MWRRYHFFRGLLSFLFASVAVGQQINWVQKFPANSPSAREGHDMVYDDARGVSVLFGGNHGWAPDGSANVNAETWTWDGSNWTQMFPVASPSARYRHAMVYDAARGQVVLFGGYTADELPSDETWVWDGANWTQMFPATHPTARGESRMAFDAARGQVVLFAGWDHYAVNGLNDTWVWDGTNWTQKSPAQSPPITSTQGMAYDEARQVVVIFGGIPSTTQVLNDTWEWDGATWTQQSPATIPPARGRSPMAYDASQQQTVLMGGCNDNGSVWADTWLWDGTNWSQQSPATTPPPRVVHSLTYDRARGQVVLFGGADYSNQWFQDTWVWGPEDTVPPTTTATPSPTPNANGWNNTDVTVALNATDNPGGSGVEQIQFALSGAQNTGLQTVAGSAASVVISAQGITTLTYFATDNAGNQEIAKTLIVRIDMTPPVIVPQITGTLGNNGWYTSNVAVSWSATDPESSIASSTGCTTTNLTVITTGTTLTCAAINGAGLSNSASVTIKIDLTPPVIVPSVAGQLGANGWYISDVTVAWSVVDPDSGIATSTGCSTVVLNAYTAGTTVSCSATNGAGLTSGSSVTVAVDEARIHTLNPTASNSFSVSGADIVNTSGEIVVNSSSTKALVVSGTAKITAKSVQVVGGFTAPASAISPTPVTGVAPRPDPFGTMAAPSYSGCNFTNFTLSGAVTATLTPGVYCGGITISGSVKASLAAGTYILNGGGLAVSGAGSLSGQGVTLYNTSNGYPYKPITFSGANTVNLSAPASGPMSGVLFFQDRNITSGSANTFSGAGQFQFLGTLYFPTTALVFSGAGGLSGAGPIVIVANTVQLSGSVDLQ